MHGAPPNHSPWSTEHWAHTQSRDGCGVGLGSATYPLLAECGEIVLAQDFLEFAGAQDQILILDHTVHQNLVFRAL